MLVSTFWQTGCGDAERTTDDAKGGNGAASGSSGSAGSASGGRGGSITGTGGSGADTGGLAGSSSGGGGTAGVGGAGASGTSGASGMSGGGSAGASGSGGVVDGTLGSACQDNSDCEDGLTCFTATSGALLGGSPASGLCTTTCSTGTMTCKAFGSTAACVYLDSSTALCLEGCEFGDPASEVKCHSRSNAACAQVYDAEPIGGSCMNTADCADGFSCVNGFCYALSTVCVPQCNAPGDCSEGRFCDFGSSFSGFGLCREQAPDGLESGEPCDPNASMCRGTCSPLTDSVAVCGDGCTYGVTASCGDEGSCLLLPYPEQGTGDAASCLELCDCNDDCRHPDLVCRPFPEDSSLEITRGRAGSCYLADAENAGIACSRP